MSEGNASIGIFQPDPANVFYGKITPANYNASTLVISIASGVASYDITSAANSYLEAPTLGIWVKILQSPEYLEAVVNGDITTARPLIVNVASNGLASTNFQGDIIRLTSQSNQKRIGTSEGFLVNSVGGVEFVISADLLTTNATEAQVRAWASGLSEQAFDNTMDQINTKINTSSLGIPVSGDLNEPT